MQLLTIAFALTALVIVVNASKLPSEELKKTEISGKPLVQEDENDEMVAAASEEVGELEASASGYGYSHHYAPKHHYETKLGYETKHHDKGHESYAHNAYDSYMPKKYKSHGYGHHGHTKYGHVSKHGSDGYTKYDESSYDKYKPIKAKIVHIYEHHSYPKHHSYKHHSYKPYEHHTESHGYESFGHTPKHHYGGYHQQQHHGGYEHHSYQPHHNNHYKTHGTYSYVDHNGSMGHYDGGSGYTKVHGSYSPHHWKQSEKWSNHGYAKHYPKKHYSHY